MLNGLFTWNWNLWYQVNTLLGITAATIFALLKNYDAASIMALYTMIYGGLWILTVYFNFMIRD